MSHASWSGDGVNIQSKVLDEQQQKSKEASWTFSKNDEDDVEELDMNDDSEETESDNDGDDLTHHNLLTYKADDEEKEKEDDDEVSFDQRVYSPPNHELTDEEEENKEGDDEDMEGEQEQDKEDDLYRDVNINLEISDAEMTNSQENQDTEDTHVTLITVPLVVQQQSSSVSSDLMSKFINPSPDTEEHGQKVNDLEDQSHQKFNSRNDDETYVRKALDVDESQWNPSSFPTVDREWHKTKTVDNRTPQPWITQMAQSAGTQSLFNEFLATPIHFSAFIMNRLKIDN
nr:hypothetical protein [Tanacetum cinerariifolium]